jgi:outer membrane protein OmpA-like peptidoglycan-associated protein
VLTEFDKTVVVVAGHTDSDGSDALNETLSRNRASSVSNYLISQKILPARFEIIGFGERQPIASNTTAEGKQLNRRVEITLLPVTQ